MKKIIKVISIVNVIVIPLIIVLVYLFFKVNIITVIRNQESLKIILILIGSSYYISSLFNLFIYKKKSYNA
jgi:hypothetical protein